MWSHWHIQYSHTHLVPLAVVPCTPERLGQVSRSCWYTLHSSVSLEPTLDCSCRLWWPLLLHFGSYQWTLCLEEWAAHSQLYILKCQELQDVVYPSDHMVYIVN